MASLIEVRETLFERHCQSIQELETNYMNRINQLLQMKTMILTQLEYKFYNQLNKINNQLNSNTVNPINMNHEKVMRNTIQFNSNININTISLNAFQAKLQTPPNIKMELPKILAIEKQRKKPSTFVIKQIEKKSNKKPLPLAPLPPSINKKPKYDQNNIKNLIMHNNNIKIENINKNDNRIDYNSNMTDSNSMHIYHNNCGDTSNSNRKHVQKHWNVMREFKPGNTKFDIAISKLRSMRTENREGNLPSLRGFMKIVHLGFPKANAVLKYYAEKEMNMTLDDFKQRYMVLRQIKGHNESSHISKAYQCNYCKLRFESQCHYQKHIEQTHIIDKAFQCTFCKKRFIEQMLLKQHVQKTHMSINLI